MLENPMIVFFLASLIISLLLYLLSLFFVDSSDLGKFYDLPFECGFESIMDSRVPFSIQFFYTTIVFLVFDLEIIIILPLLDSFGISDLTLLILMSLICFLLLLGLLIEWVDNSLDWVL
uniref:NADH dehydrogenase subunit 3 n=1 Tax=Plegadiphilus threskiornis TaxID=2965265 RepID=UPI0026E3158B|nr:NADH dehydrogenase subunit 3 [Plegadiphilus threskiornis]WIM51530.1 NADH dehydrogenase subunit 3 [Plegadiphilus threskiornis]